MAKTWRNVYLATFKDIRITQRVACSGTIAYVSYPFEKLDIKICPPFWELPFLGASSSTDYSSQVGTIIHELTHIRSIADTEDIVTIGGEEIPVYGPELTEALAIGYPDRAIRIADNYTMQIESLWGSGF